MFPGPLVMTALQTKANNEFEIRRLGDAKITKVSCRIIMASNRSIQALKAALLPDFFDRIAQHIIEIPPLSQTPEDREKDWKAVWKQMLFKDEYETPLEKVLIDWLKDQDLPGNFRDLQKIAIYYRAFLDFDKAVLAIIPEKTAFDFAKNEFQKYHQSVPLPQTLQFNRSQTSTQMIAEFKFQLASWAVKEFGGKTQAARHFKELDEKITRVTIHNWLKMKQ